MSPVANPDDALAREVWQRTGGNPFFAREVTRLLTADGTDGSSVSALTGVPLGVKAVLNARVATLSADGSTALRAGAVIGREFAVDVLAELAGWSTADAVEHLEEAVRRRVVVRQPSPSGRHRFTHDLFRDTVYDSLTPDQVRTLHLAVGRLLERKRGAGSAVPAAELATHFGAAVAAGDDSDDVIRCAVSYSAEAGHEAVSRLADEDACRHYERALSFATDAPDRTSLLLCLGHARYRCGRADAARRSFDDAGVLAGEHRDSGSLAQAALGWHRVGVRSFSHDRHGVAMIRQALAMIGDEGGPWPPLLLSALARDLHQQLGALDRPAAPRQTAHPYRLPGGRSRWRDGSATLPCWPLPCWRCTTRSGVRVVPATGCRSSTRWPAWPPGAPTASCSRSRVNCGPGCCSSSAIQTGSRSWPSTAGWPKHSAISGPDGRR